MLDIVLLGSDIRSETSVREIEKPIKIIKLENSLAIDERGGSPLEP